MIDSKDCWLKNRCNHRDCNSFCMRLYKLNYLYDKALIPLNRRSNFAWYLDSDPKYDDTKSFTILSNIEKDILNFINNGNNLYIHSTQCGNGKTSWALRMVGSYFDKIWFKCNLECKALFINVPKFLLAIKDNINEKSEYVEYIKQNIYKADIVIWDDIGTKFITPFESEHLFSFIDGRINSGKCNVYTSNLEEADLHKYLGDRLYSRILNNSKDIKLNGLDKRGINYGE